MSRRHRIGESDKHGASSASTTSHYNTGGSHNNQHNTRTTSTISLSNKRRPWCCQSALQKCIFYAILVVLAMICSFRFWYNSYNGILNGDYYYYHSNDNAYSLSDLLATRTMTTATTNSTSSNKMLHDFSSSSVLNDVDSVVNDHHNHKCAILFYGLPRSFRLLVLPSVIRNIIRPNARYRCDYFVHYYSNVESSFEAPSRSGYGGFINTSEILLLQQAVQLEEQQQQQDDSATTTTMLSRKSSVVHFTSDTNASFWQYQNGLYIDWMHKIRTTKGKRRFIKQHPVDQKLSTQLLYLPVKDATYSFQTLENILKMWHSQSSVYRLMQQHEQEKNLLNYTRVALFRSDVVYVTPIDVWKRVVNTASASSNEAMEDNVETGQRQQDESSPVLDVDNTQAVIPAFAKFPVNDRMFYGPAPAAKIWATQRLERLENHVHERILQLEPGFGMHSERYLYYTIFPAIRNETHVEIAEDEGICLLRARADESVWINDCDSSTNKSSNSNSRGTAQEYRAMIESMIGRTCQQSRLPKEIHTRVIQLRCGLNETKTTM